MAWERAERLALGVHKPKPVRDDLTEVIAVLARMLEEYHEKRPDKPLRRHY